MLTIAADGESDAAPGAPALQFKLPFPAQDSGVSVQAEDDVLKIRLVAERPAVPVTAEAVPKDAAGPLTFAAPGFAASDLEAHFESFYDRERGFSVLRVTGDSKRGFGKFDKSFRIPVGAVAESVAVADGVGVVSVLEPKPVPFTAVEVTSGHAPEDNEKLLKMELPALPEVEGATREVSVAVSPCGCHLATEITTQAGGMMTSSRETVPSAFKVRDAALVKAYIHTCPKTGRVFLVVAAPSAALEPEEKEEEPEAEKAPTELPPAEEEPEKPAATKDGKAILAAAKKGAPTTASLASVPKSGKEVLEQAKAAGAKLRNVLRTTTAGAKRAAVSASAPKNGAAILAEAKKGAPTTAEVKSAAPKSGKDLLAAAKEFGAKLHRSVMAQVKPQMAN